MSLHALATDMASRGRGPDSMLVHMAPQEVAGLQALAMKHGGSLTINPDTGLPEAGFLSKLLPMIAGFALNTFVPGLGTAIGGALGTSAAVGTGIAVGGLTGLATGSLSKGLMAGLGAYGGAGLSEGLLTAGAGTPEGVAGTLGVEGAATGAGSQSAMLAQQNAGFGAEGLSKLADSAGVATGASPVVPSSEKLLAAGAKSAGTDPLAFAKSNWKPITAASLPVLEAITTTTGPTSSPMNPGRIREKRWNGQYFEDVANTDAGVYNTSGRSFSDLYRGYNGGGIVALAEGGMPHFDAGGYTQDQINAALAAELAARPNTPQASLTEYAKSQYGLSDAQINAAYDTLPGFNAQGKYDAADYIANSKPGVVDYQMTVDAANAANPFSAQNMAKVDTTRPGHYVNDASGNPVALTNYSPGFDINNPTALTYLGELSSRGGGDTASQWFQQNATAEQKAKAADLWTKEKARLDALDATKAPTGLANLNQNQNLLTNQDQNKNLNAGLAALDDGKSQTYKWFEERGLGFTPIDKVIDNWFDQYTDDLALLSARKQVEEMKDALDVSGMNEADLVKATGKTIAQWVQQKKEERKDGTKIIAGDLKDVPADSLPGGVSGGSNTFVNDNGTITTRPDLTLPMRDVRNAYTEGGGSLGYTSPSFNTIEDFNKKYVTDRMSGDSLAAYEYLTGKKGAAYPVKSGVGQIARPYDEAVLGYPTRGNLPFTYDKATGKMVRNPDYVAPGRDEKGNVTYGMSLNDIKKYLTDTPLSGQALYDWAMTNKLSAQQIADATGRSLSSVYADFRGGAKAKTDTDKKAADKAAADAANNQLDSSSTGGGDGGPAKEGGLQTSYAMGGMSYAMGGLGNLGGYSDGGRLLKGPGDGVSDSIPATIGRKQQPARLADGEFVVPARIVSELGNGSTDAGARKLYAMMDRVQRARGKTTGKNKVAANSRADKYLPA
jgi:hypothetical protein